MKYSKKLKKDYVAGLGSQQIAYKKAMNESVKVKFMLKWRSQEVEDVRNIGNIKIFRYLV